MTRSAPGWVDVDRAGDGEPDGEELCEAGANGRSRQDRCGACSSAVIPASMRIPGPSLLAMSRPGAALIRQRCASFCPDGRKLPHRCRQDVVASREATTSVPLWCRSDSLGAHLRLFRRGKLPHQGGTDAARQAGRRRQRDPEHDALSRPALPGLIASGCLPDRSGQPAQIHLYMTLDGLMRLSESDRPVQGPAAAPRGHRRLTGRVASCGAGHRPVLHVDAPRVDNRGLRRWRAVRCR
jgi:hypothetical protein